MHERQVGQVPLDVFLQLAGGLVAVGRVRLEAAADDCFGGGADGGIDRPQPRRRPGPVE
jgi:hypothetical protein